MRDVTIPPAALLQAILLFIFLLKEGLERVTVEDLVRVRKEKVGEERGVSESPSPLIETPRR